jgi:subtilisin family serine protease
MTKLALRNWLTTFCVACSIGASEVTYAVPTKKIGHGAVVSVRGPTKALAALGVDFAKQRLPGATIENLAPGIIFVDSRLPSILTADPRQPLNPKAYSRKNNPCKRAKVRKFIASLPQRVRCEPNWAYEATLEPNDPDYTLQYARTFLSLPAAWDQTTGSSSMIAIVIDTGVQYTHPDLAANMWTNPNETPGNGIDDDGNGYIDDMHGIDATTGSGNPMDDNSHGTHCAGILGARGNNGTGIAGVAWNTKIIAAKFLNSAGSGYLSDAVESINYSRTLKLAGHNIVVSNNSWGGGGYSPSLFTAIQQSTAAGILFVAAAGNDSSDNDQFAAYPASYNLDGIIAVASTTNTGALSSFSNYGATTVDIAAPGSNIHSCVPNNAYASYSGTSMAAPQVSGLALLAQSACNGDLGIAASKNAILSSGVSYPGLSGKVATGAIANAAGVVAAASSICSVTPTPTFTPTHTATSTPTPTPTPTDTPAPADPTNTPVPPTPVPPTPTFKHGGGNGPVGRFKVRLTPTKAITAGTLLQISVDNAGAASAASLQLVATDGARRPYACPRIQVPVQDGATTLVVPMPEETAYFRTLSVLASAGRATSRHSASVEGSLRPRNFRLGQRFFRQLCSALKQVAEQ